MEKKFITQINKNHLVKKRNVLNELRSNSMTLQELRFFSIYLSKINPFDKKTRVVKFKLEDFQTIMEFGRINIDYLKEVTNSLLSKIVNIKNDKSGYDAFQLFKKCSVTKNEQEEWYIEIDAHDEALPLMFDFKKEFFSYKLWNALRLKSTNQLRMYEILKQYEKIGFRIITIEELKNYLGIKRDEYERYGNLKKWVIEVCQEALEKYTDITFTFEPHGSKGKGGKIGALKFSIYKNNNYNEPLNLESFLAEKKLEDIKEKEEETKTKPYNGRLEFFSEACREEFSENEIEVIYLFINANTETLNIDFHSDIDLYNYFHRKYSELEMLAKKKEIKHRYSYFRKLIEVEIQEKNTY